MWHISSWLHMQGWVTHGWSLLGWQNSNTSTLAETCLHNLPFKCKDKNVDLFLKFSNGNSQVSARMLVLLLGSVQCSPPVLTHSVVIQWLSYQNDKVRFDQNDLGTTTDTSCACNFTWYKTGDNWVRSHQFVTSCASWGTIATNGVLFSKGHFFSLIIMIMKKSTPST